jgi:hypothetical protein
MGIQMRNKTFISSMVGVAAAVAVAGSANAGFVDNFNSSLANTSPTFQNTTTITVTQSGAGIGVFRSNTGLTGLTGTAFPNRKTTMRNLGSSATMTGNGSAAFVLGRATSGGASATLEAGFGSMNLDYSDSNAFVDLTGTTSFSINVGSYTGGATNWTLNVSMDSQSMFDYYGGMQLVLTNSAIVNGVLTFNVADMDQDGTINWAKVDGISLDVKRAEWGADNSTVSFSLSNFQYNVVPAPGALALLGAAGLVGARRRRA